MPPPKAQERVNHPAHYGGEGNPYEVIDVIEAWGLGFSDGNAVKYIARAGKKDPATHIEDLRKAVWHLSREVSRLEKAARSEPAAKPHKRKS